MEQTMRLTPSRFAQPTPRTYSKPTEFRDNLRATAKPKDARVLKPPRIRTPPAVHATKNFLHKPTSVSILGNQRRESLDGLNNITTFGSDTLISGNPSLRSLDGLESLEKIHGRLEISNNDELYAIDALDSLQTLDGLLQVKGNHALCEDAVLALALRLQKDTDQIVYNFGVCEP